jgi:hypothetical protein
LNDDEQKYSKHKKEMTVVVHCLGIWRIYLLGLKFIVKTDNIANIVFRTKEIVAAAKLEQKFLAEYSFVWELNRGGIIRLRMQSEDVR